MIDNLEKYNIFFAGGLGQIGEEISLELLKRNGNLIILYGTEKASSKIERFKKLGLKLVKVNYSDTNNLKDIFGKYSLENKNNCLISTLGTGRANNPFPHTSEEVSRLWNINYFFNRNLTSTLTELLHKNPQYNSDGKSSHILTSSIASISNVNAPIEYCASKAALETFAKNLSFKIAPKQRINVIRPGHIYTPNGVWGRKKKENKSNVEKIINEQIPLQRLGDPNDILNIILFLLKSDSSYITGNSFTIDGGIISTK